jgi:hypothetical protein
MSVTAASTADAAITPVGLLTFAPDGTPIPTPMPMPQGGANAAPLPPPTPVPPTPSVTEVRTPDGMQRYPQGAVTQPFPLGNPQQVYPQGVYQPGVYPPTAPVPYSPDGAFPGPCLEQPPSDDCAGLPALNRVKSCNHWWGSAEYLMWWTRSMQVPPLLTTSSPAFSGILGAGDTRTVYGGDVGNTYHGGGRFSTGYWFGCDDPKWGIEGRILFLGDSQSSFSANGGQYPVLARPFFNVNSPFGQFSELIAYPGLATGSALIKTQTSIWGAEANVRRVLFGSVNGGGFELDALVGYRFFNLNDKLSIEEAFARTPGSPMTIGTPAIAGNVTDLFHTHDMFNGGQIGIDANYQLGRWSVEGRATVAFGDLEQVADINGAQTLHFANGAVGNYYGGLLALPGANIGVFHHSQFSVLPEATLNLGYQVTSHLRLFIGYDFLFLGNTLRPGGAIDTRIDASRIPNFPLPGNPAILPGAPRPGPYFTTSDFFAQGINFGMQFKW